MPREIADSDAESDIEPVRKPSVSPIPENDPATHPESTTEYNPFAHINLSQFLSPTQRLSSAAERPVAKADSFLEELAQDDPHSSDSISNPRTQTDSDGQSSGRMQSAKAKRSLSDIEGGLSKKPREKSAKRSKTYGNSRSQTSGFVSLSSDVTDQSQTCVREEEVLSKSNNTSSELPVQPLRDPDQSHPYADEKLQDGEDREHEQNSYPSGSSHLLQNRMNNTSITKSSMGGYQGINMDFRGTGIGLNMSANPFGSLSQMSLDGNVNASEAERFTSLFQHSQGSQNRASNELQSDNEEVVQRRHLKEMATSSVEESSLNKKSTRSNDEQMGIVEETHEGTTSSKLRGADSEVDSLEIVEAESKGTKQKKRGRKSKADQAPDDVSTIKVNAFDKLQSEDPLDLPQEQYKPRPSRSRAGTVDSNASHTSHASKKPTDNRPENETMNREKKVSMDNHQSSELNLSDPAVVGAPKEMYAPRPSKSRSKRMIMIDDEDELQREEVTTKGHGQRETASFSMKGDGHDVLQSASTKKKPGRKSKVKRAKTSAAALLKSAEMYDEDDKDCIILDEAPVKVKIAALPEISPVKKETKDVMNNHDEMETAGELGTTGHKGSRREAKAISIDIPRLSKPGETTDGGNDAREQPKPEPKKRGRKPKKKPEIQVEVEPETTEQEQEPEQEAEAEPSKKADTNETTSNVDNTDATTTARPALSEQDPNTLSPVKTTPTDTPVESTPSPSKKPVHSPLKLTLSHTTISNTPSSSSATTPTTMTTVTTSKLSWQKPRVGLSRRHQIPSLLRKLDRGKETPKLVERREKKLTKRQAEEQERKKLEMEENGEVWEDRWEIRGKDGMLVEWDE